MTDDYYRIEMKSFGLYYRSREEKNVGEEPVELHINLWKLKSFSVPYLLDFGLMVSQSVEAIALFLPFKLNNGDRRIKDLGRVLMGNKEILSLLFNARMQMIISSDDVYARVTNTENNDSFYIYKLAATNFGLDTEKFKEDGSLLTIDISSQPETKNFSQPTKVTQKDGNKQATEKNGKIYLRFRIEVPTLDSIKIKEDLSNDIIQSAFSKIELYDFRVNDLRQYDAKIDEAIKRKKFTPYSFSKIHFLYMVNSHEMIQDMNTLHKDCRFLEKSKWKEYLPEGLNETNFISYHWKTDETNVNFSLFFSTIYPSRNWYQLLVSIDFVIILGFVGSCLCTLFFKKIDMSQPWNWNDYIWGGFPILLLLFFLSYFVSWSRLWNKIKGMLKK